MTKLPTRTSEPEFASEGGVESGRVWCQTTVKINLGDYENMEFSFGASMPCRSKSPAARKKMYNALSSEQGVMLSSRVEEAREIWQNK